VIKIEANMKLIVAVDLSPATTKVMAKAKELATALSASVWVVHIAKPEPDFVGMDVGPQNERDAMAKEFHQKHEQVQALAEDLRSASLDATALLVQGPTVDTLIKEITKLEANMVVIGSHGKGMLGKLLVGSVSEGVLRQATCPVIIIPTHNHS
jgi:nucleotide-binding universal stress UspA family protein